MDKVLLSRSQCVLRMKVPEIPGSQDIETTAQNRGVTIEEKEKAYDKLPIHFRSR